MRTSTLRTLTTTLVLTLFAALLFAGTALAAATPGKPTAKAPKSTITTTKPTFAWSKAPHAAKYEVRVYKGSKLKVKKTGLTRLSWKAVKALPKNVSLTWKVRASNAAGAGAWSRSLKFKIVPPTLAIGDPYGGGVIAYILVEGDPGYVAGETHGLIAATADQTPSDSDGIQWATQPNWYTSVPGALGTAIGTGAANTDAIVAQNGAGTSYAAGLARAYIGGGYADWYLPGKDELHQLYLNRVATGGFHTASGGWPYYWSSSQGAVNAFIAWYQRFDDDFQINSNKTATLRVRAVRAF